jgi:riboflavin synthase
VTEKETIVMWVEAPEELAHYIATKGSISINGVSLTVNDVDQTRFRVNLIPFTGTHTGLGRLRTGDTVNLEVDIIARYLERLLTRTASRPPAQQSDTLIQNLSRERLIDLGFFHSSGK